MESFEARVAKNEATFRAANEDIAAAADRLQVPLSQAVTFVCECGDPECAETVTVTLALYERVRSDPHRFLVAPGHVIPAVEMTIEETDAYWMVMKTAPGARRIAEEEDPPS